jgi:hypothetical protein
MKIFKTSSAAIGKASKGVEDPLQNVLNQTCACFRDETLTLSANLLNIIPQQIVFCSVSLLSAKDNENSNDIETQLLSASTVKNKK